MQAGSTRPSSGVSSSIRFSRPWAGTSTTAGIRRSLQGRHPRGRHQDRRRDQGPGLLLPRSAARASSSSRPRSRRYNVKDDRPGLPVAPLRLVGQAAAVDPHRLRGVRGLRLPDQAGPDRQGVRRPRAVPHVQRVRTSDGTRSRRSSPGGGPQGSFDKYAESSEGEAGDRRGRCGLPGRDRNLARTAREEPRPAKPGTLSQRDLNSRCKRTIDRIIFLRICEDRGIEPYGQLAEPANGTDVYAGCSETVRARRRRYN